MSQTLRTDLIFPKAGHFMLIPYNANGLPDMTKAYTSANGIVVSMQRAGTINTVTLPDGNSAYPAGEYAQTFDGTLTYVLSTYDPELEAVASGANYTVASTATEEMWTIAVETVPTGDTHVITFSEPKPSAKDKIMVTDMYNKKLELATSATSLTAGQFFYDSTTGELTFAADDAGKSMTIVYAYNGSDVTVIEYEENPKLTSFMTVVIGEAKDKDEVTMQRTNIVADRCTISGDVTPPINSNDPTQGWTLTTKILKPRSGQKPVKVKFEAMTTA